MPRLLAQDHDADGVAVVLVVRLGDEVGGLHGHAALGAPEAPEDLADAVAVVGLSGDFEILSKRDTDFSTWSGGDGSGAGCGCRRGLGHLLVAAEQSGQEPRHLASSRR